LDVLLDSETVTARPPRDPDLVVRLDVALPREVEIGEGTALFVCGICFHRDARIRGLRFVIDGAEQPVEAHAMPRLDEFRSLHPGLDVYDAADLRSDPRSPEDPNLHAYLSGFWGTVSIGPRPPGLFELLLRARLDDGRIASAPLATLRARAPSRDPLPARPRSGSGPLVAICMATHNPPMDLFRRQIESIRAQTHDNWTCIVSDDHSSPGRFAAIERELAGDGRFHASRSRRRLGFYHNFERALAMVPRDADYVTLADQDDRWYADKLDVLLRVLDGAQLAYSDVRVIDEDARIVSDTYWTTRRNNYTDLLSLLVANSVTGAASLFRRELLDHALPFPPPQFGHFHDHWIALVALSLGSIAFVDRPLYDYVQHRDAVLGHEAANRMVALRERLGSLWKDPRERVRLWRHHYFVDVSRLTQCATILELRCGRQMAASKRRSLQRFLRAESSTIALLNLWRRGLRELLGTPETLGGEWMLAYAFTWRRLLAASATDRPAKWLRLDALPPTDLWVNPGQLPAAESATRTVSDRIAPLKLALDDGAPARINILIHTIDLEQISDSLLGAFHLARRLGERGVRVRLVTVDRVRPLPGRWKQDVGGYRGMSRLFDHVEVAFSRESRDLEVSPEDRFVATTSWTAHVANRATAELDVGSFLYVIEQYEPLAAAVGSDAALAEQSYRFAHYALLASAPLREYFRRHRIGVFSEGPEAGDAHSAAYEPAVAAIGAPSAEALRGRESRRLLFDAMPQPGGRADMFELGMAALQEALGEGILNDWDLRAIGRRDDRRSMALGGGAKVELHSRGDERAYAEFLRGHDVGLALAYAPQPSLTAIEMAAAGMVTVTNGFEARTGQVMGEISSNLLAPPTTVPAIVEALRAAAARAGDVDSRVRGSAVAWSRDWNASFDEELIDRLLVFLGRR
jgi:glycosyltransferase involved in cell wall biosynthesis